MLRLLSQFVQATWTGVWPSRTTCAATLRRTSWATWTFSKWLAGFPHVESAKNENGVQTIVTLSGQMLIATGVFVGALSNWSQSKSELIVAYAVAMVFPMIWLTALCTLRKDEGHYYNLQSIILARGFWVVCLILVPSMIGLAYRNKLPGQFQPLDFHWNYDGKDGVRVRVPLAQFYPAGRPRIVALRVQVIGPLKASRWTLWVAKFVGADGPVKGAEFQLYSEDGKQSEEDFDQVVSTDKLNVGQDEYILEIYLHPDVDPTPEQLNLVKKLITEGKGLRVTSATRQRPISEPPK
jgi:hypothetical protein